MALPMTPAHEQDQTQVAEVAAAVPAMTGDHGAVVFVDQGDPGEAPAEVGLRNRI